MTSIPSAIKNCHPFLNVYISGTGSIYIYIYNYDEYEGDLNNNKSVQTDMMDIMFTVAYIWKKTVYGRTTFPDVLEPSAVNWWVPRKEST